MIVRDAVWPVDVELARDLVVEYTRSLGADFDPLNFERELAEFPGEYAPPKGRFLLALEGGEAAGCAALRDLGGGACEMKRMYVRPAFRGTGLGRRLAEELIARARAAGYERMRLDTLPRMAAAVGLYRALGFREIAPYRPPTFVDLLFMELDLRVDAAPQGV